MEKFTLPLVRKVYPNLIAQNIVSVQPMTGHLSSVFFLQYSYGSFKNGDVVWYKNKLYIIVGQRKDGNLKIKLLGGKTPRYCRHQYLKIADPTDIIRWKNDRKKNQNIKKLSVRV
jgi:hypothetical protein